MTTALSTPPVIAPGHLPDSPQPALPATAGLLLRPWEPSDAPAFLSADQDHEIRRWHTRRPFSEGQVREWFDAYRQDWEREEGGHWATTRDDGKVPAGSHCAAWISTTASPASRTGCSRPPAAPVSPLAPSVPARWTRSSAPGGCRWCLSDGSGRRLGRERCDRLPEGSAPGRGRCRPAMTGAGRRRWVSESRPAWRCRRSARAGVARR
jgi:hypothetical protein